MQLDVFVKWW